MAFCTQCGKMLAEGEVCTCQQNKNQENSAYQGEVNNAAWQTAENMQGTGHTAQPMGNAQGTGYTGQQANETIASGKVYLAKLAETFFGILKKPVTDGYKLIQADDIGLSIGLILIQAVMAALFGLRISSIINNLQDSLLTSQVTISILIIAGSAALSFVLAGLLKLSAMILKFDISFQKTVSVAAARSVYVCVIMCLAIIVSFLNIFYGSLLFFLSGIIGMLYVILLMPMTGFSKEMTVYIGTVVMLLMIVTFFLTARVLIPMFVSNDLKSQIKEIMEGVSDLQDVGQTIFGMIE